MSRRTARSRTPSSSRPAEESPSPRSARSGSGRATPEEREAIENAAARLGVGERPAKPRERDNPFDDFDVPSWVER
jgi:hypothetical protein